MKNHPKSGQVVTVKTGPHAGKSFRVVDYVVTQAQGKRIDRIAAMRGYLDVLRARGVHIDDSIVFGKFLPDMAFACLPDSELKVEPSKAAEPEKLAEVKPLKRKKKDGTQKADRNDS